MILCIDIGNTNIVVGIYENEKFSKFRIRTISEYTIDEYGIKMVELLDHYKKGINVIDELEGIIISSVVPKLDIVFEKVGEKYLNKKPIFVGPGIKSGLKIKLDNPKQLGADILVGAVAAVNKYRAPVIVVDMGTATTFAVVNSELELLGGVIIPGIRISYDSLFRNTAKLEGASYSYPKNIIGKDTVSCIQSGMVYGTSSMIDGLIKKIRTEIKGATCVLTGGDANFIYPYINEEAVIDEDLLLDGLLILYKKNQKE